MKLLFMDLKQDTDSCKIVMPSVGTTFTSKCSYIKYLGDIIGSNTFTWIYLLILYIKIATFSGFIVEIWFFDEILLKYLCILSNNIWLRFLKWW